MKRGHKKNCKCPEDVPSVFAHLIHSTILSGGRSELCCYLYQLLTNQTVYVRLRISSSLFVKFKGEQRQILVCRHIWEMNYKEGM